MQRRVRGGRGTAREVLGLEVERGDVVDAARIVRQVPLQRKPGPRRKRSVFCVSWLIPAALVALNGRAPRPPLALQIHLQFLACGF